MKSKGIRQLEFMALKVACEVQDWVRSRDKVNVVLKFKHADRMRLLKLRSWEIRYRLPIAEILDIIVKPIREHSRIEKRYGLGTSVASITGNLAHQILTTIIGRKYPTNEHLGFWREQEREKQLRAEKAEELDGAVPREANGYRSLLDAAVQPETIEQYVRGIEISRRELRKAGDARWRTRKHYRGNPWLTE